MARPRADPTARPVARALSPTVPRTSAAQRAAAEIAAPTPASAGTSPTTWSAIRLDRGRGLARRPLVPYAPAHVRPGDELHALRPGDLRGAQGLPAAPTARSRPSGRCRTPQRFQRSARRLAMPELPAGAVPRVDRGARRRRTATGSPTDPEKSLYLRPFMFSHRGRPRRAARQRSTCTCSSPRRPAPTSRGGVKPVSVWLSDGLRARGPRRHRRGQVRRQLRRVADRAGRGRRSRAATRSCGSTPRSTAGSRRWAG